MAKSLVRTLSRGLRIHPNRWLARNLSYSRFMGHVWPKLIASSEQDYWVRRKLLSNAWWPKELSAPLGNRLLVISPHPDDETIGAGGVLLAHKGRAEIHILCLTDGERGGALENAAISLEEERSLIGAARRKELTSVAETLAANSLEFLGLPDGELVSNSDAIASVRQIVERIGPDVVLLPWFLDNHPDHRACNRLYAEACRHVNCMVLGYEIWGLLEPNAFFDMGQFLPQKLELIRSYTTQLRTVNYLEYSAALAQVRAFHAALTPQRAGAVEAFVALPNEQYCDLAVNW